MVEVIVDQTEWRIPLASILIIEDQPELQQLEQIVDHIKEDLNLELEFICASNFEKAREALESRLKTPEKEKPLLILLDLDIPYQDQKLKNGCGGYQLIRQYHEKFADSCWVLLTTDTIRSEKESYGEGTLFDNLYRLQPFDVISRDNLKDLEEIVRSVLTYSGLSGDKRALPGTMIQFDEYLYGFSNYKLYHEIRSAAEGTRSILLFGETGTGKMLTARLIHYYSQRWNGKFHILDGIMGASELEKFFSPLIVGEVMPHPYLAK